MARAGSSTRWQPDQEASIFKEEILIATLDLKLAHAATPAAA